MLRKVDFFCIGAQKAGTTLLYEHLKSIDDIYLPNLKELHFFDDDEKFIKGRNWYEKSYFKNNINYKISGEITPSYLFIESVPKRIFEMYGKDTKFIVILRNPVERAYSHYTMKYRTKEEELSFIEALIVENMRIRKNQRDKNRFSYLNRGFYAEQLERYFEYFDRENFIFLTFEEYINNQDDSISQICRFLGVDKNTNINNKIVHNSSLSLAERVKFGFVNSNFNFYNILFSKGYPKMDQKIKKLLDKYYKGEILKLEILLDKDFSLWYQ